nr:hypothetical protein [Endozoicomonas sp.]
TYNGQTVNIPQITTYFASPDGTHLLAPLKNSYPKCDLLLKYHKGIPTLVTEVPKCNPNTGGGFNINGDTLALYPMNVGQSQPSPSLLHILTLNEEGYWVKANIFEVERKIRSIAFSPDDRRMAVAHGDKISVYGRDANNEWVFNASVTVEPRSPCHWQTSIDFLPDSGSIEVLSQSDLNIDKDNVNYCCSTVTISPIASVFRS